MKWYKHDPDAFIAGVIGLKPEEIGVYIIIIDLLYSRDGNIPADDAFFAKACGCAPQMWRRIRDSLLAKGKLHYKTDGKLTANRVDNELISARYLLDNSEFFKQKYNKNNEPTLLAPITHPHPHPDLRKKEKPNFKNGNGKNGHGKPAHGQRSKDGRIWFDRGTTEFADHSVDYADAHFGEKPKLNWNGAGAWFNIVGERPW